MMPQKPKRSLSACVVHSGLIDIALTVHSCNIVGSVKRSNIAILVAVSYFGEVVKSHLINEKWPSDVNNLTCFSDAPPSLLPISWMLFSVELPFTARRDIAGGGLQGVWIKGMRFVWCAIRETEVVSRGVLHNLESCPDRKNEQIFYYCSRCAR